MGEVGRREQKAERLVAWTERAGTGKLKLEEKVRGGRQEGRVILQKKVPGDEGRIQRIETEKPANHGTGQEERRARECDMWMQVNHG